MPRGGFGLSAMSLEQAGGSLNFSGGHVSWARSQACSTGFLRTTQPPRHGESSMSSQASPPAMESCTSKATG
eukprot:3530445-Alexandrium_andersonii.AAC.1